MYTPNPAYPQYPSYPMTQQPGYAYGPKPQPRCTQPVTSEMSKMLHQQADDLSVKISKVDSIKNQCTHKEPGTGRLALIYNQDGTVTCRTCGETFHLIEDPRTEIEGAVNRLIDILQTTKVMYLDVPEDFVKEYFQCISLVRNLPKIYEKASNNFSMYENYSGSAYPVTPGFNTFQAVNNIMSINPMAGVPSGYAPMGVPQQMAPQGWDPNFNPGMMPQQAPTGYMPAWAQAGYQATPPQQMAPQYPGQPQQFNNNPMAYGAPGQAPAPTPGVTGPTIQPPAQQTEQVTQTKDFKV